MSMTVQEARAEAVRRWVGSETTAPTRADQVAKDHRAQYPVVKAEGVIGSGGVWAVGYNWHRPFAHHMNGMTYDRIMGRGKTLEEAFARADAKRARGASVQGVEVYVPARVARGLLLLVAHAKAWEKADGWPEGAENNANIRAALKWVNDGRLAEAAAGVKS